MNNSRPIRVGITGGIGSGKSIVCQFFKILGIPVYSADDRAKWLMSNDPELKSELVSEFGEETYMKDGTLDRAFLAQKVFSDSEKVKKNQFHRSSRSRKGFQILGRKSNGSVSSKGSCPTF
jgi:dephospho-CoA kinase